MNVQEIGQSIESIIDKRRNKLPQIEEKLTLLEQMEEQVSLLKALKDEMISEDGEILENGRFTQLLKKNPEVTWSLQELQFDHVNAAIQQARKALQEYYERCNRERINISVVGMARIGKSELLKAISGLSNYVIPAFDSTDCTGATSVINNEPSSSLTAKVTFKTPDTMRQMAQTYLNRMIPDLEKRPILRSMKDVQTISLADVKQSLPKGSPETILLPYLEKMVAHYEEWAPLTGSSPLTLTDEKQIMTYVAQNNGVKQGMPGREEYFRYLAVDSCVISCSFPEAGIGRISLIDTVGLGDHTIGIADNMMQTIKSQSDAVIFVHNPRDGSGGGFPKPVAAVYERIYEACKDKKLDEWLYYLINHVSRPTAKLAQNTEHCKSALALIQSAEYCGAKNAKIIDVMDVDAVRYEFLVPLLENVALHLDDIDEIYRVPAETGLQHLRTVYNGFCLQVRKALQTDLKRDENIVSLIRKLTGQTSNQLGASVYQLALEWRKNTDMPCVRIDRTAQKIFRHMSDQYDPDSFLPSEASLRDALCHSMTVAALYEKSANAIRNKVSNAFLDLDQEIRDIIVEMKGRVAKALYDDCDLRKLCEPPAAGRPDSEWLKDFSEMVLGEGSKYPSLKLAFDTLSGFTFSVKAFLAYEVRDCLSLLDPHLNTLTHVVKGDARQDASILYYQLYRTTVRVQQNLANRLKGLLILPNRAVVAALLDFIDRVYYAENAVEEWYDLLAANAGLLWADQIREHQRTSVLCDEWMDVLKKLQVFNQSSFYQL